MSTRWAAWSAVVLVAWFVSPVLLVRRELTATVVLRQAPVAWTVGWRRAADGFENGVWIDAGEQLRRGEMLEIAPLPRAGRPGGTTVRIVAVHALAPRVRAPALAGALRRPAGADGSGWSAEGTGAVHRGVAGAPLRVPAPAGGVEVWLARSADGGPVVLRYGGQESVVDTAAIAGDVHKATLVRQRVDTRQPWQLVQPLPAVALSGLTLGWEGEAGGAVEVRDAAVVVRVAGIDIARKPLALQLDAEAGTAASGASSVLRVDDAGARGKVRLEGSLDVGWLPRALAAAIGLGALVVVRAIVVRRAAVVAWIARVPAFPVALAAIVAVRVWMAGWVPVLFYPDSTDYVNYALQILEAGQPVTMHPSRTSGYAWLLAPLVWGFDRFGPAIGIVQAAFGILSAVLVWDLLRSVARAPWPVLGMLFVGFDPVLLGYERVALSETTAMLVATLAGWGVVRAAGALLSNRTPHAVRTGVLLGLLCAAAVHVRGNFQTLLVLVPAALLAAGWRSGRLRAAVTEVAIIAVCGALAIGPRILENWRVYGTPSFVVGQQYQRFVDGYAIGVVDENQTAAFDFEQWRTLRRGLRSAPPTLSGLDLLLALMRTSRLRPEGDVPEIVLRERVAGPVLDESLQRRPERAAQKALAAFSSQIGLWDEIDSQYRSAGNIYLLAPLRGLTLLRTNLMFDEAALTPPSAKKMWFDRVRESTAALPQSLRAVWYNEFFWAGRFLRPVVAVLFLAGLVAALRERKIGLLAAGAIAFTNALALGVLVLSDYDRYSVPFTALAGAVATFGLARLVGDRNEPVP